MSTFNPDTFLSMETANALPSKYTPYPAAEYRANVTDVKGATVKTKNGDKPVLTVTFGLLDADNIRSQLGLDANAELTVRRDYWLDLTDGGAWDFGPNKNVQLGQLREALGQNKPGQPWSPLMMRGAGPVLIKVGIGSSEKSPDVEFNTVDRVTKAF